MEKNVFKIINKKKEKKKKIRRISKECMQCRSRRQPWKRTKTLLKENNNFSCLGLL